MDTQPLRQELLGTIAALPQKALLELAPFVNYLQYKFSSEQTVATSQGTEPSLSPFATESDAPLYERLSPEGLSQAFLAWAESHRTLHLPSLSDQAISRESIY